MIPELLACFQVLHERHVTLESQFGGIAQRWAASHQDIIPAKLQREAIMKQRKKKNCWRLRMFFNHTCRSPSPLQCIWSKHCWPKNRLDPRGRKTLGESLRRAFGHGNMYPKDPWNHMWRGRTHLKWPLQDTQKTGRNHQISRNWTGSKT